MSTANFTQQHEPHVYAIVDAERLGWMEEESEGIKNALSSIALYHEQRKFASLGTVYDKVPVGNRFHAYAEIVCSIQYGYYEGANLSYRSHINFEGYQYRTVDDFMTDVPFVFDIDVTEAEMDAIHELQQHLEREVQKVFTQHSDKILNVFATFSNGEVLYRSIKPKKQ